MENERSGGVGQDATKEEVLRIIADHLGRPTVLLSQDSRVFGELGGDEFDRAELIMTLEEMFSLQIPGAKHSELMTVGDFVAAITRAREGHQKGSNSRTKKTKK